jgi:tripartite-type tricarboxylate transporter receptor subunit TctC
MDMQSGKCIRLEWFRCTAVLLIAAGSMAAGTASAQTAGAYPTKAIRMLVAYPPGGGNDFVARAIADPLAKRLGQQIIIDNRGGGGTIIAAELAARAPNDGYTLFLAPSTTLAILPHLKSKLPFDPVKDYDPVSLLVTSPYLLVVHPSLPVTSVKEFIALAKAKPGTNYASPGPGSVSQLAAELFKVMAGINLTHVPYKGTGPAVIDVIAGHVSVMFASTASVRTHAMQGRLRGLAVTTAQRLPELPGIPTIAEAALPGYQMNSWNGVVAPRGTPRPVIARLNSELLAVMRQDAVRQRLSEQGLDPEPGTPQEFSAHIRAELARFGELIKTARITE